MASADVTHDELRPLLFSLAYRMVGGVGEAEDLVQEAYLRLLRSEEEVEAPKAFLTTVVTRLAIDYLRSARVRREAYVGPWLPEPLVRDVASGPAELAESDETLSLAFLTLLERFLDAVRMGDVDGLVGLLAADAVHYADGGGKARATLLPIFGAQKIARLWASLGRTQGPYEIRAVDVNGQPGVAATGPDGTVLSVITVDVSDDRVQAVWAVVNPDKLARVPPYSAAT